MNGMVARGGFEDIQTQEDVSRFYNAMLADIENGHEIGTEMWWIIGQNPNSAMLERC